MVRPLARLNENLEEVAEAVRDASGGDREAEGDGGDTSC